MPVAERRYTATATIANGASLSGAVDLTQSTLCVIQMPAAWTTANLTFQGSLDGTNYFNVYKDDGTEYTVVAAASLAIVVRPADFMGFRYMKIRSGTSGTAVAQGAARDLTLGIQPV